MSTRRVATRLAGLAAGLFVAMVLVILGVWMWRAGIEGGLTAMARLLRHGTTTVDDFRVYPGRTLAASPAPALFSISARAHPPPPIELEPGLRVPLASALDATQTLAFVVVRDDAVVYEHYGQGHAVDARSQYFSVTKSILATLAAMAVDDGILG